MEIIETRDDERPGWHVFSIEDFDVQVIVTPIGNETSYIEVYDAAGLAERVERPADQAERLAVNCLFWSWKDDQNTVGVAEEVVSV